MSSSTHVSEKNTMTFFEFLRPPGASVVVLRICADVQDEGRAVTDVAAWRHYWLDWMNRVYAPRMR
jgi:hypothetical protein